MRQSICNDHRESPFKCLHGRSGNMEHRASSAAVVLVISALRAAGGGMYRVRVCVYQYQFCTACSSRWQFCGRAAKALTSIHFAFELGALERILNDFPLRFAGDLAENRVNNVCGPPRSDK